MIDDQNCTIQYFPYKTPQWNNLPKRFSLRTGCCSLVCVSIPITQEYPYFFTQNLIVVCWQNELYILRTFQLIFFLSNDFANGSSKIDQFNKINSHLLDLYSFLVIQNDIIIELLSFYVSLSLSFSLLVDSHSFLLLHIHQNFRSHRQEQHQQ